jgi:hypothetical protein
VSLPPAAAAAAAGVAAAAGGKDTDKGTDTGTVPAAPRTAAPEVVPPTGTAGSVFPDEEYMAYAAPVSGLPVDQPEGRPFDQTNGLDTTGDSDGTALSDTQSAADRERDAEGGGGTIPPLGGTPGQH